MNFVSRFVMALCFGFVVIVVVACGEDKSPPTPAPVPVPALAPVFSATPAPTPQRPSVQGNQVLITCADGETTAIKEACEKANVGKYFNFTGTVNNVESDSQVTVKINSGNNVDVRFAGSHSAGATGTKIEFWGKIDFVGTGILVSHRVTNARMGLATNSELEAALQLEENARAAAEAAKGPKPKYLLEREQACAEFEGESNAARQSRIFEGYARKNMNGIKVNGLEGTLSSLLIDAEGNAAIVVATAHIEFPGTVERNTGAFKQLEKVSEGDRVKVTGRIQPLYNDLKALATSRERELLCGDDWIIKPTRIVAQ